MPDVACRRVAIWIDRQQAILCAFGVSPFEDPIVHGCVEGWSCRRVDARLFRDGRQFYEAVFSHLEPEDELLILGPGLAKRELRQQLERHGAQSSKVVGLRDASRLAEVELVFPTGDEWCSVDMGPTQAGTVLPRPALHSHSDGSRTVRRDPGAHWRVVAATGAQMETTDSPVSQARGHGATQPSRADVEFGQGDRCA